MSDNFKVGIDYGGTKIEGILMDDKGNEILRKDQLMIKITRVALKL